MEKGLVSVIMPNYNGEDYIEDAINSVLIQTYNRVELIIIDDGSTDNSRSLINSKKDRRIRPVFLPYNGQICNALNVGLGLAQGEYIARIDSDDIWEADKLEKQLQILESNSQIGACFSWVNIIDDENLIINRDESELYGLFRHENTDRIKHIRDLFYQGCYLCHPTVIMRKEIVDQVGLYDFSLVQIQDYDYWLRLLLISDIYIVKEELVRYRRCQDLSRNLSSNTDLANIRSLNENMIMKSRFINSLTNSQFNEIFKQDFKYEGASSDEELECEKAFILLNSFEKTTRYPVNGVYKMRDLLNNRTTRELLEREYCFTDKDFYELMSQHIFYDYILEKKGHELEEKKNENECLLNENAYLKAENKRQKDMLNSFAYSKSWNFTRPFRTIMTIMRRVVRPLKNIKYHYYFGKNKIGRPNVFLMNTEDYWNLGSLQIAVSEMQWLEKNFKEKYRIHEIPATKYEKLLPFVKKYARKDDIFFIHGGGNIGNEYLEPEERRRQIIELFPDNQIYSLPQTVYFNKNKINYKDELARSQKIYDGHKKLKFFVRDQVSYDFMRDNFKCEVILTPDMVMYSEFVQPKKVRENKIILNLRHEFEAKLSQRQREYIYEVAGKYAETVSCIDNLKDHFISVEEREQEISEYLSVMKTAGLIITDRLHGMIFAALTETPCIVVDNYNQKVSNLYKTWLEGIDYICFAKHVLDIEELIPHMYQKKCIYKGERFRKIFDELASMILLETKIE